MWRGSNRNTQNERINFGGNFGKDTHFSTRGISLMTSRGISLMTCLP